MGALPNLLDNDIEKALTGNGLTPEQVAAKIAQSKYFIKAVKNGMVLALPLRPHGATSSAGLLRIELARLFNASTANQMFK